MKKWQQGLLIVLFVSGVSAIMIGLCGLAFTLDEYEHGLDRLYESSFLVDTDHGTGSGPAFVNHDDVFVWTAGHVICSQAVVKRVIDAETGQPKVTVHYRDVHVVQEDFKDGRKVSKRVYNAKVLRCSSPYEGGEDIALLRLYDKGVVKRGIEFAPKNYVPRVGSALWLVGSHDGYACCNSVGEGCFAAYGRPRLRFNIDEGHGWIYDQVSLPSLAGASGSGVFLKSNNQCIGLLTEGATQRAEAINFIVPSRRIREFAARTNCLWALDSKIPVPSDEEISQTPVSDTPLKVPEPPPAKRPASAEAFTGFLPFPFPLAR